MIHLRQATLDFGSTRALDHCDLEFQKGEQVALIGPSGSGKSSLLKVLATEYNLSAGEYALENTHISSLNAKLLRAQRKQIAYIPQHLALVPNLKVSQNVLLGKVGERSLLASLADLLTPAQNSLQKVLSILTDLGIGEKIFHRTDSLSGGQQQRVAIARALYQEASILLADEPVSAIDPSRAHALLRNLTELSNKHGVTLLCSMHNLDYAKTFFPRLIGMRNGKVVFDGASRDFTDAEFNALYSLNDAH